MLQPLKLAAVAFVLVKPMLPSSQGKMLAWLGHLGRWSLLDVFFALLLIMIVCHEGFTLSVFGATFAQANISAHPEYGLYLFQASIICSMGAVTVLQQAATSAKASLSSLEAPRRSLIYAAGGAGYMAILLSFAAFILHILSFALPAFSINGVTAV